MTRALCVQPCCRAVGCCDLVVRLRRCGVRFPWGRCLLALFMFLCPLFPGPLFCIVSCWCVVLFLILLFFFFFLHVFIPRLGTVLCGYACVHPLFGQCVVWLQSAGMTTCVCVCASASVCMCVRACACANMGNVAVSSVSACVCLCVCVRVQAAQLEQQPNTPLIGEKMETEHKQHKEATQQGCSQQRCAIVHPARIELATFSVLG